MGYCTTCKSVLGFLIPIEDIKYIEIKEDDVGFSLEEMKCFDWIENKIKEANDEFKTEFEVIDSTSYMECEPINDYSICIFSKNNSVSYEKWGRSGCETTVSHTDYDPPTANAREGFRSLFGNLGLNFDDYNLKLISVADFG